MTNFRKLPHVVSAVYIRRIDEDEVVIDGGEDWVNEALEKGIGEIGGIWVINSGLRIGTMEGTLRVNAGDYIVKGIEGEIYPVKGSVFAKSYEQIDAPRKV